MEGKLNSSHCSIGEQVCFIVAWQFAISVSASETCESGGGPNWSPLLQLCLETAVSFFVLCEKPETYLCCSVIVLKESKRDCLAKNLKASLVELLLCLFGKALESISC